MKKNKKIRIAIFLVFSLFAALSGCGYTANRILPENINTVYIPIFANRTLQYKIENHLSDTIMEEFIMDGRLKVSNSDKADSVLQGEITQFLKQPISTEKNNTILEYKLTIALNIALKDTKGNILWERKNLNETFNFYNERQSEQDAITRLIKNLSRKIVISVIEGD